MTKETIDLKFSKLEEVIKKLEGIKKFSKVIFLKHSQIQDAALYNLIIGIEAITDIGNFILSQYHHEVAKTYKDIIIKLGEHKVIPRKFADENAAMADLRNFLIHVYEEVDIQKVYLYIKKAPDIFRKFAKYYIEFMDEN